MSEGRRRELLDLLASHDENQIVIKAYTKRGVTPGTADWAPAEQL